MQYGWPINLSNYENIWLSCFSVNTCMFYCISSPIGCPNQCSGKGRCVNSACVCAKGWSGEDCSTGDCGRCVNGKCETGFCKCEVGWENDECSSKATCLSVNNCTDENHGRCLVTDKCLCNDGYIGDDCSVIPTCDNVANCNQRGICVDHDMCKCDIGYTGLACEQYSCEFLQVSNFTTLCSHTL